MKQLKTLAIVITIVITMVYILGAARAANDQFVYYMADVRYTPISTSTPRPTSRIPSPTPATSPTPTP